MDDPTSTIAELNNAVRQAWAAVRPGRVRPWLRACFVVSELFWPLEAGTHATLLVYGSEGQYHVPPIICSELFQCAVLIFSLSAKCELGDCALLA